MDYAPRADRLVELRRVARKSRCQCRARMARRRRCSSRAVRTLGALLRRNRRTNRRPDARSLARDDLPAVRPLRTAYEHPENVQVVVEHLAGRAVAEIDDSLGERDITV